MRGALQAFVLGAAASSLASCELSRTGFGWGDGGALDSAVAAEDARVRPDGGATRQDAEPQPDAEPVPDDAEPPLDSGTRDAGPMDAATRDAATPDAGPRDAGSPDAGPRDAGAPACPPPLPSPGDPLVRYTFNAGLVGGVVPDEAEPGCFPLTPVSLGPGDLELAGGTVRFAGGHLELDAERSAALSSLLLAAGAFSVEVWVSTGTADQDGPARIVSLSTDTLHRAFTLGHDKAMGSGAGSDLIVRLRTTASDDNGEIGGRPVLDAPGVFASASSARHLVLVWTGTLALLFVDGVEVARHDLAGATLDWPDANRLVLGDENGGERVWRGRVHQLSIFTVPLGAAEIDARHGAGPD